MPSRSSDEITSAIEHLRTWASAKGIVWVRGLMSEGRGELPTVHFGDHDGPRQSLASAEAFSRTLDALDVAMLVVSTAVLDEDTQQAAVALYEGEPDVLTGAGATKVRAMVKGLLSDVRAARKHIGEPGSVLVAAITRNPTVMIHWSATADWYIPIEASELAYAEMDDVDVGAGPEDDDGWEEIEPEPPPPLPPRRRIPPRR